MHRTIFPLLVILGLLASACGTEASPSGGTDLTVAPAKTAVELPATTVAAEVAPAEADAGFPATIETAVGPVTVEDRPTRIVSFSSTATEILFAIGAGEQVLAVDSLSDFPTEAPTSELSAYEPNVESIIELGPDLVVITFDPGDLTDGLDAAGIPVITQFTALSIEDAFQQYAQLGRATGHLGEAEQLVADMRSEIETMVASVPDRATPLTYYHELDSTLYSVTSSTFIGELYSLLGLVNVADPADDGSAFGYPQLSAEYLVEADPDLIFLADTKCCAVSAGSLAERPGWSTLTAVAEGRVVELDDDIASRWGPRMIDFLRVIAAAVEDIETAGA